MSHDDKPKPLCEDCDQEAHYFLCRKHATEPYNEIEKLKGERAMFQAICNQLTAQLAEIGEAFDHLWGFWDGNTMVAIPGYQDDIQASLVELANAIGETRPPAPEAEEE